MRLCALSGALSGQAPQTREVPTTPAPQAPVQERQAGLPEQTEPSKQAEQPKPAGPAAEMASPSDTAPVQPAPRRTRASRSGATVLSIKSMTEEETRNKITAQDSPAGNAEPDDDAIREKWQELAALYGKKPRLANAISSASLEITGEGAEKKVVFKVFNTAQRDWIAEKCLRELEGNFQKLTGSAIRLEVDVIEDSQIEAVPYMPSEKADFLIKKNDEVKTFVQDLGLDIR